jgi:DNA-binding IclR family transcriptional regulator
MAGNAGSLGRSVTSKVTAILHTFACGDRHSLAEVSRLTGLPPTTAYRLLKELVRDEILERSAGGMYQSGLLLQLIGGTGPARLTLHRHGAQVMDDLAATTRTEPVLATFDGTEVVELRNRAYPRLPPTKLDSVTVPAHATAVGKVLLAFAPPGVVDAFVAQELKRYTRFTITDPHELRRTLALTRVTMVAQAQRELDMRTVAIATPVFAGSGGVVAALGLHLTDQPVNLEVLKPALMVAARCLSRELGTAHHWSDGHDGALDHSLAVPRPG